MKIRMKKTGQACAESQSNVEPHRHLLMLKFICLVGRFYVCIKEKVKAKKANLNKTEEEKNTEKHSSSKSAASHKPVNVQSN